MQFIKMHRKNNIKFIENVCCGSPEQSEMMALLGPDPVRRKIIVDNRCSQQVKNFKYLGCEISYESEKDFRK
jgi:hypothetical protein